MFQPSGKIHFILEMWIWFQVEKRAIEVWGSEEQLEEERERREEERIKAKTKKYNKQLKGKIKAVSIIICLLTFHMKLINGNIGKSKYILKEWHLPKGDHPSR